MRISDGPLESRNRFNNIFSFRSNTLVNPIEDIDFLALAQALETIIIRRHIVCDRRIAVSAIQPNARFGLIIIFHILLNFIRKGIEDSHTDRARRFVRNANVLDAERIKVHAAAIVFVAIVAFKKDLDVCKRVLECASGCSFRCPFRFRSNRHMGFGKNGTVSTGEQWRGAAVRNHLRPDVECVGNCNPVP